MAKTLLLIDGSNYLFRAFHALPDLRTSAGEPTGAIKGFVSMLGAVRAVVKPDYGVVVFDAKGKTFRSGIFPDYKANRPPMPEDLAAQIPPIHEFVRAMGWKLVIQPGVEADDVMGTLATRAKADGLFTYIATGDKDLNQLVEDGAVATINTMSHEILDEAGVAAKFGVPPSRIIDYLALMGDKVDNVPGVEKCGPKTAAKWIAQYGSLDGVRENAGSVKGKIGENLRAGLPFLETARDLVTIRTSVEVPDVKGIEDCVFREPDATALDALYRRWEMRSTAGRLKKQLARSNPAAGGAAPGAQGDLFAALPDSGGSAVVSGLPEAPEAGEDPVAYEVIETAEAADGMAKKLEEAAASPEPAAIEVFATSSVPMEAKLEGFAVAAGPSGAWYVPLLGPDGRRTEEQEKVLAVLKPWLEGPARKAGHSVKFILHVMANEGIDLLKAGSGRIDDTRLEDYVIESHNRHELDRLALRWLRRSIPSIEAVLGKGASEKRAHEADPKAVADLAVERAAAVRALHARLSMKLAEDPGERLSSIYEEIELPTERVLFRMERTGTLIDTALLARESEALGVRIDELQKKAWEEAGEEFNLNSPKQLAHVLFEKLGLPAGKKTASGGYSTNEDVLSTLALTYPLPKTILEHRALSKLKGTYTDKLPRMIFPGDGRVHTTFGQATAVTGRLASSDPNLQNIPVRTPEGRRVREAFVAPPGWKIISADYSQIELRIMAHISEDPGLVSAFRHGMDVHRATAAEVFGVAPDAVTPDQRRMAKVINFGLIYGMSAFGLAQNLGVSRGAAAGYIGQYFDRYPRVKDYMERTKALAHERGYVETAFGRRLWLPDITSTRAAVRSGAERQAINAPMQGTASDLIKMAMVAVEAWLEDTGKRSRMVLQVHDELVLEVPDAEVDEVKERLPAIMDGIATLRVPLVASVGVGPNWEAAH